MAKLRLVKKEDLKPLAGIYRELYRSSALNEDWTEESACKMLSFYYTLQPDIFVVAESDRGGVIGAIASLVKPWHDGNRLIETEVFVAKDYQHEGVGSMLFHEHFRLAIERYDAKVIEAHTYQEEDGHPLSWYKKQGYEVVDDWYIINGNVKDVYRYFDEKM